ncbi:ATP-binding protein [Maridesulfovibrio sp. FT414]|uniref:ATP-binding protein n=1 Tax=Maridesulfovibrio sp. FT414 TaxID=2979469 RepID=UPI003D800580
MNLHIIETAKVQARTSIEKDIIYRRWNTMHGGVFVPAGKNIAPNPYLDEQDREIASADGGRLVRVNPAYMTRQVHELGETVSGISGHITSLNPIRPENRADAWEESVLRRLEKDKEPEASGVQIIDGRKYLRMMISLVTEQGCLKCHARQGYKLGDIRGGISVSVPLDPVIEANEGGRGIFIAVTLVAWALGCLMIYSVAGIKKAEVRARVNEKKYRTLVETMGEGIVYLDCNSSIVFCNPPFASMLGYGPDDLRGVLFQSLMEDSSGYSIRVEGITDGNLDSFELSLLKKNGSEVVVLFSPRVLRGNSCETTGLLAVTTDISRLKKMEQEMLRQQRLSSVGMLAGGVAYEIGAPLKYLEVNSAYLRRAFEGFSDFMKNCKQGHEPAAGETDVDLRYKERDLSRILCEVPAILDENDSSLMRIADITSSIRELAGTGPVSPEPENLNALVRQCAEITRSSWEGVAEMDLELSPDLPELSCIARDINQVLITIIMNAVDAIRARVQESGMQGKGTIRIASGRLGGEVRIVISDNGIGIAPENMDKIFEPFFTTKKPGAGTGQGLAVALRIMNDHKGSIVAESFSGRGAIFVLTLPFTL